MITQGKWRMIEYTASPGVRLGTSSSSPFITDLYVVYSGEYFREEEYQFLGDGTFKISYLDDYWGDMRWDWSVSADQKTFVMYGESFDISSFKDGEFVLSGKEMVYDNYLKEEVPQQIKMIFKRF